MTDSRSNHISTNDPISFLFLTEYQQDSESTTRTELEAVYFSPFTLSSSRFMPPCMLGKLLQLCLNLSHPMDYSSPASSVHGILQARILELVAMPSSEGSSWFNQWLNLSFLHLLHWHTGSLPLALPVTVVASLAILLVMHSLSMLPISRTVAKMLLINHDLHIQSLPWPQSINVSSLLVD